jgi:hypothetical protein
MASTERVCREPVRLSNRLERRLNAYALAASAAGVGMLALAQPVEGKIVYTKANVIVGRYSTQNYGNIDFNGDGISDVILDVCSLCGDSHNEFDALGRGIVSRVLKAGDRIGPKDRFTTYFELVFLSGGSHYTYSFPSGSNAWTKGAYLGAKFLIQGKVHYGWARFTIRTQISGMVGLLQGYAYETTPNKSIIAGQQESAIREPNQASTRLGGKSGTLGALARGAGNGKNTDH